MNFLKIQCLERNLSLLVDYIQKENGPVQKKNQMIKSKDIMGSLSHVRKKRGFKSGRSQSSLPRYVPTRAYGCLLETLKLGVIASEVL